MRKLLSLSILLLLLSSCVNQRSVMRWIRNHPDKLSTQSNTQYIVRTDTIKVAIKGDTISKFIVAHQLDTVFQEGRAEVKIILKTDTITKTSRIYLRAICKPDTLTVFKTDTVEVRTITNIGINPIAFYHKLWFWLLIALAIALYLYYKYNKEQNTSSSNA